jgi:urease
MVITNALIVDYSGIYKADVGIKGNNIVGIGKAGNPDVMANVTPGMTVGVNTEAMGAEGLILTAGGLDVHVHYICPQIATEGIAAGLTTLLGGGTGPASGTTATTCTPAPNQVSLQAPSHQEGGGGRACLLLSSPHARRLHNQCLPCPCYCWS